jgi:primosomal replication protein N
LALAVAGAASAAAAKASAIKAGMNLGMQGFLSPHDNSIELFSFRAIAKAGRYVVVGGFSASFLA